MIDTNPQAVPHISTLKDYIPAKEHTTGGFIRRQENRRKKVQKEKRK